MLKWMMVMLENEAIWWGATKLRGPAGVRIYGKLKCNSLWDVSFVERIPHALYVGLEIKVKSSGKKSLSIGPRNFLLNYAQYFRSTDPEQHFSRSDAMLHRYLNAVVWHYESSNCYLQYWSFLYDTLDCLRPKSFSGTLVICFRRWRRHLWII